MLYICFFNIFTSAHHLIISYKWEDLYNQVHIRRILKSAMAKWQSDYGVWIDYVSSIYDNSMAAVSAPNVHIESDQFWILAINLYLFFFFF